MLGGQGWSLLSSHEPQALCWSSMALLHGPHPTLLAPDPCSLPLDGPQAFHWFPQPCSPVFLSTLLGPDPCSLPLDEGSCTAYTLRWYHRAGPDGTEACRPFVYGGCGGNANRFGTLEACKRRCQPHVTQDP